MEIFGYLAMVCIGLSLGCLGAGGTMLAIPVFVYLFSLDMMTATTYSLFLVGSTCMAGLVFDKGKSSVEVRTALMFGIPSVAGSFVGRTWMVPSIPEQIFLTDTLNVGKEIFLLSAFAFLLASSGLAMILRKHKRQINSPRGIHLIPAGILTGTLTGILVLGGGFLIVPVLSLAGLTFNTALRTALMIIACNCFAGFGAALPDQEIRWPLLLGLTALATIGMIVGKHLFRNAIPTRSFELGFAGFSLLTAAGILLNALRNI